MGEWEYKIIRLNDNEHGVFVCRATEWRLFLTLANIAAYTDSSSVVGPSSATDIARAMGWERDPKESSLPVVTTTKAEQEVFEAALTAAQSVRVAHQKEQEAAILEYAAKRARAGEPVIPPKAKTKRKPPVVATVWTESAVALLKKLRGEALSYEVIAKTMTKELGSTFTSSMCSAKADRLGIPKIPSVGGRPPKIQTPKLAQDAKADEGEQNDGDSRTAEAIVHVPPPVDAGAYPAPAAGANIVETAQKPRSYIPPYPDVKLDSVGYWPTKPMLTEAVEWYRNQGNRVFKINGHLQVFDGEDSKLLPPEVFLERVNELRQAMSLDPFEIAA